MNELEQIVQDFIDEDMGEADIRSMLPTILMTKAQQQGDGELLSKPMNEMIDEALKIYRRLSR